MKRFNIFVGYVFIAVLLNGLAQGKSWKVEDFAYIPLVDSLALSPAGDYLFYGIRTLDFERNREDYAYFLLNVATGESHAVPNIGNLSNARWSPNGDRIGALRAEPKGTSIVSVSKDGSVKTIFSLAASIDSFEWSHDGSRIAFVSHHNPTEEIDRGIILNANSDLWAGRVAGTRDLSVLSLRSGRVEQFPNAGFSYGGTAQAADPQWSSDDKELLLLRQPTAHYQDVTRQQHVIMDIASGKIRVRSEGFYAYPDTAAPTFSASGDIAQVRTWDGTGAAREDIFVNDRNITAGLDLDFWSCGDATYAWGDKRLLATALQGTSLRLFSLDPTVRDPIQPISPETGSVTSLSASRSGMVAYAFESPDQPVQIFIEKEDGSGRRKLTNFPGLPASLDRAQTRIVSWVSGGHTLQGLLTLPNGNKPAPLIVELHGGPQCSDSLAFSGAAQYFATNGYAFFRPNPRGSDGYGDWSYKSIVNDWAYGPTEDVKAGVAAVQSTVPIESSQMYVEGASYGGYLTSWIATHPSPFRAAVAGVPIEDMLFQAALSRSPGITERFFGPEPLRTNADRLKDQSPLTYAADLRIPLLILSNLEDNHAPYPQAIMFYKVALQNHKEIKLIGYPGLGHGFGGPVNRSEWYHEIVTWFSTHGGPTSVFQKDPGGN